MKIKKEYARWLVLTCFLAILFYVGTTWLHLKNVFFFLPVIFVMPFLLLIAFRYLRDKGQ